MSGRRESWRLRDFLRLCSLAGSLDEPWVLLLLGASGLTGGREPLMPRSKVFKLRIYPSHGQGFGCALCSAKLKHQLSNELGPSPAIMRHSWHFSKSAIEAVLRPRSGHWICDGGLMLLRQVDWRIGLSKAVAGYASKFQ